MATAIVKGRVFNNVVNESSPNDPEILKISRKIAARATPEKEAIMKHEGFPADDVDIWTKDGRVFRGCELYVKWQPQNSMTVDEAVEKFNRCASIAVRPISQAKLDGFVEKVLSLDRLDEVRSLMAHLN
jgi:2-methylcitrate dehydratase PrpD